VLTGMSAFHLAQMNTARLRAPLHDPSMREFADGVALMNDLADRSPGFVWRLAEESGDGTIAAPADPATIFTLSVWESLEALRQYVYQSAHLDYLRRRRDWFVPHGHQDSLVLWWLPAGRIPTLRQGISRLGRLRAAGPAPDAFTFRQPFGAPEAAGAPGLPAARRPSRSSSRRRHAG
jgi:uncharacterized protein DUF3291